MRNSLISKRVLILTILAFLLSGVSSHGQLFDFLDPLPDLNKRVGELLKNANQTGVLPLAEQAYKLAQQRNWADANSAAAIKNWANARYFRRGEFQKAAEVCFSSGEMKTNQTYSADTTPVMQAIAKRKVEEQISLKVFLFTHQVIEAVLGPMNR